MSDDPDETFTELLMAGGTPTIVDAIDELTQHLNAVVELVGHEHRAAIVSKIVDRLLGDA